MVLRLRRKRGIRTRFFAANRAELLDCARIPPLFLLFCPPAANQSGGIRAQSRRFASSAMLDEVRILRAESAYV